MTDDDINRKVAEIEGWYQADSGEWFTESIWESTVPPYATDWAWCGPLLLKYELELRTPLQDEWWAAGSGFVSDNEKTPQRAICMAVIASKERKSGTWAGLGDK